MRILSVGALVLLVAAGCGGAARRQDTAARGVPRALAQAWAAQASAIADAAAAGNSCGALHLASSLRTEVINDEAKVPARLRQPLVAGVNALADRLVCQVPPQTVTVNPTPPKPHGHKKDHPGQGGNNGDQG